MESVTAVCSASLRRMWQATISKCFVSAMEEQEAVTIMLLRGEVVEAREAIDELQAAVEERDSALEITKQAAMAIEEKLAASKKESERLQQLVEEKVKELQELQENYSKMEKQVEEVVTKPCSCFFSKHIESYLYEIYKSDEEEFLAMDEPPVPRTMCDTEGFLPESDFKIQLSDYEYSDESEDSDASTETSSSKDTSDGDVRYINSDETDSPTSDSSSESSDSTESEESDESSTSAESDEDSSSEEPTPRRIPLRPMTTAAVQVSSHRHDTDDLWWLPQ